MLKIGFVTTSLSSEDGWGRYSKSLVESMSKFSDVSVITQRKDNHTYLSRVFPVLPDFGFNIITQAVVFFNVMRYLRHCDIIHSLVEPFAPGTALAGKLVGAKFIMTLHGTYSLPPERLNMQSLLIRYALKATDLTTTGSKYTETKARKRVKFSECIFIPNGVDPKQFYHIPEARPEDYILSVGWLKPRKGADLLLKAFAKIKDEFPLLRCKLAGGVENESFHKYLLGLVQEGGIADRVDFLGRVSDEELVQLYNSCQALVFPARDVDDNFEGFPMVFYEANACGAPVITTRGFGSEYAIRDGYNGILVGPEDIDGIAEAVRSLLSNPLKHEAMRSNALETARSHTWDKISENYLVPFYNKALRK